MKRELAKQWEILGAVQAEEQGDLMYVGCWGKASLGRAQWGAVTEGIIALGNVYWFVLRTLIF